jgi:hypothetical protein
MTDIKQKNTHAKPDAETAPAGRGAKAKPATPDAQEQRPPSRFTELADREVLHLVRAIGNAPDGELAWLARRIEAARERVKHR